MEQSDLESLITDLELAIDRLRSLYDQYFMGIEKIEPAVARKDVDRKIYTLRKEHIRNTALRFRFQMTLQRYNTFQSHWQRICREIENGTYKRHVLRAEQRFGKDRQTGRPGARRKSTEPPPMPAVEPPPLPTGIAPVPATAAPPVPPPVPTRPRAKPGPGAPVPAGIAAELAELDKEFAPPPAQDEAFLNQLRQGAAARAPAAPAAPAALKPDPTRIQASPKPPPPIPRAPVTAVAAAKDAQPPPSSGALSPRVAPAPAAPHVPPLQAAPPRPTTTPKPPAPPHVPAGWRTIAAPIVPPAATSPRAPHPEVPARPAATARVDPPQPVAAKPPSAPAPSAPLAPAPPPQAPAPVRAEPVAAPVRAEPVAAPARAAVPAATAAVRAAAPAAARADETLNDSRVRQLYVEYVEARRRQNESTAAITYDAMAQTLRASSAKLQQKHGRAIDFEVTVRDGKAVLKPVVK